MADDLSDLLRPSLGEAHDVVDVRKPLSPEAILFATFFFGIAAGWILTALNDVRCGLRRRVPWMAAAGVALLALWGISLAWTLQLPHRAKTSSAAAEEPRGDPEDGAATGGRESARTREELRDELDRQLAEAGLGPARRPAAAIPQEVRRERARNHRYAWKGLGLFAVYLASLPQRRRVRISRSQGIEMGSLVLPIVIAAVAGMGLLFAIAFTIGLIQ